MWLSAALTVTLPAYLLPLVRIPPLLHVFPCRFLTFVCRLSHGCCPFRIHCQQWSPLWTSGYCARWTGMEAGAVYGSVGEGVSTKTNPRFGGLRNFTGQSTAQRWFLLDPLSIQPESDYFTHSDQRSWTSPIIT